MLVRAISVAARVGLDPFSASQCCQRVRAVTCSNSDQEVHVECLFGFAALTSTVAFEMLSDLRGDALVPFHIGWLDLGLTCQAIPEFGEIR